ncbi:MAG TPA: FIST N-terminal domain-containing protein [Rariglobus sp.]
MKPSPSLQLRHGASAALDAHGAVGEIRRLIHQDQARLILFFCSANYDLAELAAALHEAFGSIPAIGCTVIGHVGTDGFTTGGITAISLAGDITAHPYAVDLADAETTVPNIGKETKRLIESLPDQPSFGLLLVDGLSLKEELLTSLLYRHLPQIPVVGGSASGHQASGPTHVYVDGAFRPHAAVFTLFQTPLPFRPIKFAHFESMENTLVVTRSAPSKRVIHELNGEPATQVYADLLGVPVEKLDARTLSMHPLILEMGGEQYLRAIASANPDQSLTLFCVIEDGVVLSIGRAVDPAEIAQAAFQRVRDEIGPPALVIGCDCVSRRMEFEANGLLSEMGGIMKANQVFGFSTYGEQYDGLHMNQTFTGIAIGNAHVSA